MHMIALLHARQVKTYPAATGSHPSMIWFAYLQANQTLANAMQQIAQGSKRFTAAHAMRAASINSTSPLQAIRALRLSEELGSSASNSLAKANQTAQSLAIDYWAHVVSNSGSATQLVHVLRDLFQHSAKSYQWLLSQPKFLNTLNVRAQQLPADSRQRLFDLLVTHIGVSVGRLERQHQETKNSSDNQGLSASQPLLPAATQQRWPSTFWGTPQAKHTAAAAWQPSIWRSAIQLTTLVSIQAVNAFGSIILRRHALSQ
jgi:hypothetical protein